MENSSVCEMHGKPPSDGLMEKIQDEFTNRSDSQDSDVINSVTCAAVSAALAAGRSRKEDSFVIRAACVGM